MMSTRPPYRLHASLGYQLSLSARIQEKRLEDGLKTLGLTRILWCALLAVGNEKLRHPSDIAAFVGIDRTATSRALRQMEAAGLIARSTSTGDRRMTSVTLTAAGRRLLARGTPLAIGNNARMVARLSPEEETELRRLLMKIREGDETPLARF